MEPQSPPTDDARFQALMQHFQARFKSNPSFACRAPGRVNLIGEHIDYMGYGVLPMAIEQDIMIVGRKVPESNSITFTNTDSKYHDHVTSTGSLEIDTSTPHWYSYFLCGYRGVVEKLGLGGEGSCRPGMEIAVCGRIPTSAGLSSSSAFVCAAALITSLLYRSEQLLSPAEYAQLCCDCERYIGTQGGGMDQSISFLAEAGKAKMIDFNPIRATDVKLPEGYAFVIGHSLAELNKAATSDFNQRVVECRLACQYLAMKLGENWKDYRRLGDLQAKLGKSFDEMLTLVETHMHKDPYSMDEICKLLTTNLEELVQTSLSKNTEHLTTFYLYERANHVFAEAKRVLQFKRICDTGEDNSAELLGRLMTESHVSTRDWYECSHPDLDRLVETCLAAGALGSRLTGAGWGGCCVSIVREGRLEAFLERVRQDFYTEDRLNGRDVNQVLFKSSPAGGACVYKL